ncbi:hypothetical protein QBC45DRAFT_397868 [Copromyces sp. CBS 386.78]|nr:hypothetical protein QBC45DRAFT_397868 [Copromyces sp. CBS 386.78]
MDIAIEPDQPPRLFTSFEEVEPDQLPPLLYHVRHADSSSWFGPPPTDHLLAGNISQRVFSWDELNELAMIHAYNLPTMGPTRFLSTFEDLEEAQNWASYRRGPVSIHVISTGHFPDDAIVLRIPNTSEYLFLHWIPGCAIVAYVKNPLQKRPKVEEYQHIYEPVPGFPVHVPDPPCAIQQAMPITKHSPVYRYVPGASGLFEYSDANCTQVTRVRSTQPRPYIYKDPFLQPTTELNCKVYNEYWIKRRDEFYANIGGGVRH